MGSCTRFEPPKPDNRKSLTVSNPLDRKTVRFLLTQYSTVAENSLFICLRGQRFIDLTDQYDTALGNAVTL